MARAAALNAPETNEQTLSPEMSPCARALAIPLPTYPPSPTPLATTRTTAGTPAASLLRPIFLTEVGLLLTVLAIVVATMWVKEGVSLLVVVMTLVVALVTGSLLALDSMDSLSPS